MFNNMPIVEGCTYTARHPCFIGTRLMDLRLSGGGFSHRCAEGSVITVRTLGKMGIHNIVTLDIEGKPHHSRVSDSYLRRNFHLDISQEMLLT